MTRRGLLKLVTGTAATSALAGLVSGVSIESSKNENNNLANIENIKAILDKYFSILDSEIEQIKLESEDLDEETLKILMIKLNTFTEKCNFVLQLINELTNADLSVKAGEYQDAVSTLSQIFQDRIDSNNEIKKLDIEL